MIDYLFPPMAGSGVQRTLNYVKHLGEFGWSPIVLTAKVNEQYFHDVSLLDSVPPGVHIERTAPLDPIGFLKRFRARNLQDPHSPGEPMPYDGRPAWRGPSWIRDIERLILFPDRRIGWFPFAAARALAVSRRQKIDVIYSTSTIVISHLVGYVLAKLLHTPWVADFQDWWAEDLIGPVHKWAGRRFEHMVLRNANFITFTTDPLRKMFHDQYPTIPPQKLGTIPMGFDPEAFQGVEPIPRSKFTIIHFGSFYSPRSPGPFLQALAECAKMHDDFAQHVEVLFFGKFDAETFRLAEDLIGEGHLSGIVRLEGLVPYKVGVQQITSADVLLLVTAQGKSGQTHIPSKLFEYLATGRPILALAPEGAAAQIVHEANAGIVVDPADVRGIRDAIRSLYRRWIEARLVFPIVPAVVEQYAWREITRRFAAILEDALTQPDRPGRGEHPGARSSAVGRES